MNLNVGDEFEMVFPFRRESFDAACGRDPFQPTEIKKISYWIPGCDVHHEQYDQGCGETFFTAHGEGKVIYKVLSIAKMPGRYVDRVIFHRHTIDPDGVKNKKGEVRILTVNLFERDVNSVTPFKREYEVENA